MAFSWTDVKKEFFDWIRSFVLVGLVVVILSFFIQPTTVVGQSMNNTLEDKDVLILQMTKNLNRGDIVAINSNLKIREEDMDRLPFFQRFFVKPGDGKKIIKRVVALSGDRVGIKDGLLFVNDQLVEEAYVLGETYPDVSVVELGDEQVFVLGDNREFSNDSRSSEIGLINLEDIKGRVIIRLWPIKSIGTVD